MDTLALVQLALEELGDAPAQELSTFIERRHGTKIDPKFMPIFKASIRDKQRQDTARQAARAAVEQVRLQAQGP